MEPITEIIDQVRAPGEGDRSASGISFSKGPRVVQCLGSTVLPRVQDAFAGFPAEQGKAIHAFFSSAARLGLELGREKGREAALDIVPAEFQETCATFDLSRLPTVDAEKYSHEVAMAYDALEDKARIIGYDMGRNYGELADGEIPGTLDVLGLTDDEGVVYPDYKSGRVPVPAPKKNWQMRIGGLAAARRYNARYAVLQIIHTRPGMKPWTETDTLDAFELEETAEHLRELVLRRRQLSKSFLKRGFAGLGESLVRGEECRYCPSASFCPAQTSHIRAVTGDPIAFQREIVPLITPEQLGLAKVMHSQLKGLLEQLGDQIEDCVKRQPAVMPSGRYYGPVQQADDTYDGQVTFKVLDGWIAELTKDPAKADKLARIAVQAETSKAAIERALKEIAPRGSLASMMREALKRIAFAGGKKTGTKTVIREYTAGSPKALPARGQ